MGADTPQSMGFGGAYFGGLRDRFGVPWMLSCQSQA
jgi:uncharacterized glyoxalase superfamily protein PhnB